MRTLLLATLSLAAGCNGTIGRTGELPRTEVMPRPPDQVDTSTPTIPGLPAASTCKATVVGRSYRGLAGEVLEAGRLDVDPSFDRLRPLPNPGISNDWSLLTRIQRDVGGDYHSVLALRDPSVGNTFGNVPPRWYDEADIGAFSLSLSFNFAFESCLYSFQNQRSYRNTTDWYGLTDVMPTAATARTFCGKAVRSALSRAPREAELEGCVSTLMDVLALGEETEPRRVWAYGCAFAVATPMYLTY